MLNEKVSRYTLRILELPKRGSSESVILIFGRVLACAVSDVNKVTDECGADIN